MYNYLVKIEPQDKKKLEKLIGYQLKEPFQFSKINVMKIIERKPISFKLMLLKYCTKEMCNELRKNSLIKDGVDNAEEKILGIIEMAFDKLVTEKKENRNFIPVGRN